MFQQDTMQQKYSEFIMEYPEPHVTALISRTQDTRGTTVRYQYLGTWVEVFFPRNQEISEEDKMAQVKEAWRKLHCLEVSCQTDWHRIVTDEINKP